jgi:SNF2 family DNA or RNA helicase
MNFKTKPMIHQEKELSRAFKIYDGLLWDMGTGKSKQLIDTIALLYEKGCINAALIIGNKGSYQAWISEHLPGHMSTDVPYEVMEWRSTLTGKRLKALEEFTIKPSVDKLLILTANVESLISERAFNLLATFTKKHRTLVAIDESSTIRNPKSGRTKAAFKLRDLSIARRILTGSPIDNRPTDIWAQLEFLKKGLSGYASFYAFKTQFSIMEPIYTWVKDPNQRRINIARLRTIEGRVRSCIIQSNGMTLARVVRGGTPMNIVDGQNLLSEMIRNFMSEYNYQVLKEHYQMLIKLMTDDYLIEQLGQLLLGRINKVVGYQNLGEFKKIINEHCSIVRTEDCLDLPERVYQVRQVELTDEQKRVYKQLKEESLAWLDEQSLVTASMVLAKALRLHQVICGFVKDVDDKIHKLPSRRVDALLDLLQEVRGKVLIYSIFRETIFDLQAALSEEYGPELVRTYFGDTTADQRLEAVESIQHGDARFFITNHTGAYGLNLTAINYFIGYCNDFDAEPRNQVEKRLHRIGQTKTCFYTDLVAPGTVDQHILDVLKGKKQLSDSLTPSNWRTLFE